MTLLRVSTVLLGLSLSTAVFAQTNGAEGQKSGEQQGQEEVGEEGDAPANAVFTIVETMPQFPGGEEALFKYLVNEVVYPKEAIKKGIAGTVYMTFVVDKNGDIVDARVLRGVHPLLDEESVRVVSTMPRWTPGTQEGKPVRVQYTMPIKYSLQRRSKKKKS